MFRLFDRVVFYTEAARDEAVATGIVPACKAWFANNTLDTDSIWDHYSFEVNENQNWTFAFLGRLDAERKRLNTCSIIAGVYGNTCRQYGS